MARFILDIANLDDAQTQKVSNEIMELLDDKVATLTLIETTNNGQFHDPTPTEPPKMVCDDMHGTQLAVGDRVTIVDVDEISYHNETRLKKGDVIVVDKLNDHESNHMDFKTDDGQKWGLFGHRVVKIG